MHSRRRAAMTRSAGLRRRRRSPRQSWRRRLRRQNRLQLRLRRSRRKAEAAPAVAPSAAGAGLSAAEAAREVKGQTSLKPQDKHVEFGTPPTTRVVRGGAPKVENDAPRTQLVRGKVQVKRGEFAQDPVVGWLVIVGGAGMGCLPSYFRGQQHGRAAPRHSGFRWISATIRFPRKSRPISAMIRPHDLFCSCRT